MDEARKNIVGINVKTPLIDGSAKPYIYLDNAASTPALQSVLECVNEFMPWYSSIHRGSGFKSQLASRAYDDARRITADFFGANDHEHVVIFGKNTTEAINKLSFRLNLNKKDVVLVGLSEHHSNDLPWRKAAEVHHINVTEAGGIDESHLAELIKKYKSRLRLVAITGASNVTGMTPDIHRIAASVHAAGAQLLVDCAQLAAHRKIDMKDLSDPSHLDYISVSAHKMYAPFGTGALIGRRDTFEKGDPEFCGGGTIKAVTTETVQWADPPEREEAGSPNVVGAVALAISLQELSTIGMPAIAQHEVELTAYALEKLRQIPGIRIYGDTNPSSASARVGVIPFNLGDIPHGLVAAILSAQWGIGVRDGCFCAHPYVTKLLGMSRAEIAKFNREAKRGNRSNLPGMIRISFGMYNTEKEVDRLVGALEKIAKGEYQKNYRLNKETGEYSPNGWKDNFDKYFKL